MQLDHSLLRVVSHCSHTGGGGLVCSLLCDLSTDGGHILEAAEVPTFQLGSCRTTYPEEQGHQTVALRRPHGPRPVVALPLLNRAELSQRVVRCLGGGADFVVGATGEAALGSRRLGQTRRPEKQKGSRWRR